MIDDLPEGQTQYEGGIGQSASTAGLARRIVFHWNQAVKETGDGTYPIIIAKFAARIAFDEREACANVAEEFEDDMGYGKAQKIADAIRLRSNVEFSGTPAALSPEAPLERRVGPGAKEGA